MLAAHSGHADTTQVLIAAGADVNNKLNIGDIAKALLLVAIVFLALLGLAPLSFVQAVSRGQSLRKAWKIVRSTGYPFHLGTPKGETEEVVVEACPEPTLMRVLPSTPFNRSAEYAVVSIYTCMALHCIAMHNNIYREHSDPVVMVLLIALVGGLATLWYLLFRKNRRLFSLLGIACGLVFLPVLLLLRNDLFATKHWTDTEIITMGIYFYRSPFFGCFIPEFLMAVSASIFCANRKFWGHIDDIDNRELHLVYKFLFVYLGSALQTAGAAGLVFVALTDELSKFTVSSYLFILTIGSTYLARYKLGVVSLIILWFLTFTLGWLF